MSTATVPATVTYAATDRLWVDITGRCDHCFKDIKATPKFKDTPTGVIVVGQFDWYHTETGNEACP